MSRSTLDTSPDFHIRLLDQLLAVIPHVLPPDEISFPVLWHTDLHAGNIMVKPEDKPDVVGILDWQGMSVAPLFMQSVFAKFVRYTGDDRIVVPPGIKIPSLPPDFELYPEDQKADIKRQLRMAILHKRYEVSIIYNSPYQACCTRVSANGARFTPFVQCIEDMIQGSPPSLPISHRKSEQLG